MRRHYRSIAEALAARAGRSASAAGEEDRRNIKYRHFAPLKLQGDSELC
jgi:hypothetical protein